MTQVERIRLLIILIIIGLTFIAFEGEAAELKLNLLPKSWHHGSTNATNERHTGIGLSISLPNGYSFGAMHYKNSFDDNGWMVSASTEFEPYGSIYPGVGVGYAPSYAESGHNVGLGWISFRYKWVTMMTAPGEVTAFVFSIPLN